MGDNSNVVVFLSTFCIDIFVHPTKLLISMMAYLYDKYVLPFII